MTTQATETGGPAKAALPRDNLVRAISPGFEFRDASDAAAGTLTGHLAVFNEWAEIDSMYEGHFMERIAPGAFRKTFREQRDQIRVLLNHGQDPQLGDKPIAAIQDLREDKLGAYYEARVFDGLPQLVLEGLRANQYGASFRFTVMQETFDRDAKASAHNPQALAERTIKELRCPEFGPVTFPAYAGATAALRSLTYEHMRGVLGAAPARLVEMIEAGEQRADIPSLQALMAMYQCGLDFIDYEDDDTDAPDRDAMQQILNDLEPLIAAEATEDEAAEVEPPGDSEDGRSALPKPEAAPTGTSGSGAAPIKRFATDEEWHEWISKT